MSRFTSGRHENGQNFLKDHQIINRLTQEINNTQGAILEIGGGAGAISRQLAKLGRELTIVEYDPRFADRLQRALAGSAQIVLADYLDYRMPSTIDVVVGNLPFHLTTAILRKLLNEPDWQHAVLLTQWEVARRRTAVGGASLLTAQVWPWFEFSLLAKVPAQAFMPRPSVDGGLFSVARRQQPLVPIDSISKHSYRSFVQRVFTGPGRGISQILWKIQRRRPAVSLLRELQVSPAALPKELTAEQWAALWRASCA